MHHFSVSPSFISLCWRHMISLNSRELQRFGRRHPLFRGLVSRAFARTKGFSTGWSYFSDDESRSYRRWWRGGDISSWMEAHQILDSLLRCGVSGTIYVRHPFNGRRGGRYIQSTTKRPQIKGWPSALGFILNIKRKIIAGNQRSHVASPSDKFTSSADGGYVLQYRYASWY